MTSYNPSKIEKKWQKEWLKKELYFTKDKVKGKKNFYHLVMFPYPSGDLHMGHWYNYGPADVYARFKRMQGYNIMSPIGFDAFGLPAENAAINRNLDPKEWTYSNIKTMKKQLSQIGTILDWSREVITSEPNYYRWTQWIFLKLYEAGLAKREKVLANWCPHCKTILANEQVQDGRCERCDTVVEQRLLDQWVFKITNYAQKLLDGLNGINWPETTKILQKNWIGRSEGALIKFQIPNSENYIEVFTTRPDTIFGATFMVLAPEHKLVKKITKDQQLGQVNNYLEKTKKKTELERLAQVKEKTGVFTGAYAVNPANSEKIPIWISDFVLPHYGTGAIMAVPAHDQRDLEFAKKFKLPVRQVIAPHLIDYKNPPRDGKKNAPRTVVQGIIKHWEKDEVIQIVWKGLSWKTFVIGGAEEGEDVESAVQREVREETGYTNIRSIRRITPEIRSEWYADHKDENRYARMNIFLVELDGPEREEMTDEEKKKHDVLWVSRGAIPSFAPVGELDYIIAGLNEPEKAYTGEGIVINSGRFSEMPSEKAKWGITKFVGGERKITYRLHDWIISRQRYWGAPIPMIHCPKCGTLPVPEKDLPVLLPKIKDYKPPGTGESPLAKSEEFVKTKCSKCFGEARRETDTMDTFVDSAWYFLRYADQKNRREFVSKEKLKSWLPVSMYIGGQEHATKHLLYARFITKVLHDLGYLNFDEPFTSMRHQGLILGSDGNKMSKSRGNVVDPDEMVKKFGSDLVRMYLCFMGPYENGGPWDPKAIVGVFRFLNRVWSLLEKSKIAYSAEAASAAKAGQNPNDKEINRIFYKAIKKVGEDIENLKFNTAVSGLMKLLNSIEDSINKGFKFKVSSFRIFLKLLAPFAPHMAEELWREVLKNKNSIHLEKWPQYDPKLIKEEMIDLVIQVNGKVRDTIRIQRDLPEKEARDLALKSEKIKKHIAGKEIKKFIYILGKLVNFVT
ncbi:MAG: leucyl-tRNA synthetase [Parcubacteria group bacterium Gr01-1014_2]|nr:MAG: leucyl-tRNA synthetase [Parcubacteria group bacterium Gr01-1014_2]